MDKARRKDLTASYKQQAPDAGVYRLVNRHTGRTLLASTMNLRGIQSKLDFARTTNSPARWTTASSRTCSATARTHSPLRCWTG